MHLMLQLCGKYGLIETLRQNVWEQLTEDLFPHLKRSAQLYYGHMVERMSSETTFNAIYPEFYFFFYVVFCLVTKCTRTRDILVQSKGGFKNEKEQQVDWKRPLWSWTTAPTVSEPEEQKETTELQHSNREPGPKQWLYSPKSLSLFHSAGGATLNSATEFDDWITRSVLVLQFTNYHWIFNWAFQPRFHFHIFFSKNKKSTCPEFQKIYKK